MSIERHQVAAEKMTAARADFTHRIGAMTRSMSKAGPMGTYEWEYLADMMRDHLAARSVDEPALDSAEAWAVLADAAEASAAVIRHTAYHPWEPFHVFLDYVNFGMSYDRDGDDEGWHKAGLGDWLDAYCLAVLADRIDRDGEAFHFVRKHVRADAAGVPAAELVAGLLALVAGDLDEDDQEFPPPQAARTAAVDAALARIAARERETGRELSGHQETIALRVVRALVSGDRAEYDRELTALLRAVRAAQRPTAPPRSLLPLVPLALAAWGHRQAGWPVPVDTAYLPRGLVTGYAPEGPRVGPFGRDRRPDAVAALAAGPVTCARPTWEGGTSEDFERRFEERTRQDLTPASGATVTAWNVAEAMRRQRTLFLIRGAAGDRGAEGQGAALRLASGLGALLFRAAATTAGGEVRAVCGAYDLVLPASDGRETGPGVWQNAAALALINGDPTEIAALAATHPSAYAADRSAFAPYREALHAHLNGADAQAAAHRAVLGMERANQWGFFPPPAVLLSQLVGGDEESFNLALLDALEAHRAHHSVADRGDTTDALLNPDVLALACQARRRGWRIRVTSPYLPDHLLAATTRH
ncbi:Imm49 family immunity protein [Streptomyces sp. NPDC097619]|uniref:immunity 49 family protein n=1 Tax=Streptomyces sp. NPDC097619 TaxID=3157228 RepID=UPI00331B3A15